MRLTGKHQFRTQMVNCGISSVIVFVGKSWVIEKSKMACFVCFVIQPVCAFIHAEEEAGIHFGDLFAEHQLQQEETLIPPGKPSAVRAAGTSGGSILRLVKEPHTPHVVALEPGQLIVVVGDGPAD